jgi:hypothetical protein
MIVHQAIGVAKPIISTDNSMKGIKKGLAVLIVPKDFLSFIAPAGKVINGTGELYA